MDAKTIHRLAAAALGLLLTGARFQTNNFVVETANPQLAKQFALAAENYRYELAVAWLGKPMPDWSRRCLVTAQVGPHLGAGGATTFVFDRGEVFGWRMTVQGSAERILDSVLPHEITHTIFACHFRRPLPRWADEGGATTVEHPSERAKQYRMLVQFLRTGRGIAFARMFRMSEYPRDIMPLYAQGYTLAEFLIQQGGRQKYLAFLADGMEHERWNDAVKRHYGYRDLGVLQDAWLAWVRQGFPQLKPRSTNPGQVPDPVMLASAPRPQRAKPKPTVQAGNWPTVQRGSGTASPAYADTASPAAQKTAAGPSASAVSSGQLSTRAAVFAPGQPNPRENEAATSLAVGWQPKSSSAERATGGTSAPARFPTSPATSGITGPEPSSRPDPFAEPIRTQVTHPQPIQPFRQIILQWGHR